jgi:hypothetical protein
MKTAMAATGSLARLALALTVALVLGSMLSQNVDATMKSNLPVSKKVANLRELCETTGGTFSTESTKRGTKYTTCNEADGSVTKCTATKKAVSCHVNFTAPPDSGPAASPTGGVYEDPGSGGGSGGGGNTAGGGAAADPSGTAAQPDNPVVIQTAGANDDDQVNHNRHDGKRKQRGHGGKRGKQ